MISYAVSRHLGKWWKTTAPLKSAQTCTGVAFGDLAEIRFLRNIYKTLKNNRDFLCSAAIFENNLRNIMKKGRPLENAQTCTGVAFGDLAVITVFRKYSKNNKIPPKAPPRTHQEAPRTPKHFQERPKDLPWTPEDPLRTKNTRKYHNLAKENVKKRKHDWKVTKWITDTRKNVNTNIIFQTER